MKSPTKLPRRYGRRRTYNCSPKTQILSRKRVPIDVEVDGDVRISPLDEGDAALAVDENNHGGNASEASESNKKNDTLKVAESTRVGRISRNSGGKPSKRPKIRGSLVDNISSASRIRSKCTKTNSLLISNPNEFVFFQKDNTSSSSEKACSRDNNQQHAVDKNLLLDPSLFPNDASTNKSANTKNSSGTSKKSSATTAKASEGKSGITGASASTARTKNTLRLAPRKKTPGRSKFKKGSPRPKIQADAVGRLDIMKELKEVPIGRNVGLPPPENITFRSKSKGKVEEVAAQVGVVQVWEDEVSVLTGATKMKRVLRDVANRVKSGEAEAASYKVKKPVRSEFRTKTARQKRKSTSEELVESKKQCIEKVDPCVIFSVPQFESRRDGTDRFQERKYLGLIEGVGGGIDELDKPGETPNRGRLLEMPGELMPGTWKAQVLDDAIDGISYERISLRHENVEYFSLEARIHEDNVSIITPQKNRVNSFIDQEILYDEEIDDTEGEEKVLGNLFIGCLSLVWFDGFYTSTDAIKLANETAEGLLKLCVPPENGGVNNLCKIVRNDFSVKSDECVGGVLYRCKLDFDDEYTILLSYSGFEIDAVDVIFKKIDVHSCIAGGVLGGSCRRGLTPSIISHHLDCVGSTEGDVMGRWINGDDEKYSYLPPTDEIVVYHESEESHHSDDSGIMRNRSFSDFLDEARNIFNAEEKGKKDSNPVVADSQKLHEHLSAIYSEAGEITEHEPHDHSFENTHAEESAAKTKHSTSPALEAVKKRAYTTIQSQIDVEEEFKAHIHRPGSNFEPSANSSHNMQDMTFTAKRSSQSNAIRDLSLPAVEVMQQVDEQNHINQDYPETSKHKLGEVPICDITKTTVQSSEEPKEPQASIINANISASKRAKVSVKSVAVESFVKQKTKSNEGTAFVKTTKPSNAAVLPKRTNTQSEHNAKQAVNAAEKSKMHRRLSYPNETKLAQSKLKRVHTPMTKATNSSTSKPRKLFDTSSKNAPKKRLHSSAAKSTKKKEYIGDLFGENESMFGIPTIKTPLARRKSVGSSHGKTRSRVSKPKLARSAPSKTRQLPSIDGRLKLTKDPSPVVTPSRKSTHNTEFSVAEEVLHLPNSSPSFNEVKVVVSSLSEEEAFHDATADTFEEPKDQTHASAIGLQDVQTYSSSPHLHDVYYGQAAPSPCPTLAVPPPSTSLESPDRFGSFHDYYYGREHCMESEDDVITPSDQPLHDVYFGQYMRMEQLFLEEFSISPDSSQAVYDIYFGQQEIQRCINGPKRSHNLCSIQRPRRKYQNKFCFVLLAISSMFKYVTQPVNTRYQKSHSSVSVFAQTHFNHTHVENEIISQEKQTQGWFSAWYQGY